MENMVEPSAQPAVSGISQQGMFPYMNFGENQCAISTLVYIMPFILSHFI